MRIVVSALWGTSLALSLALFAGPALALPPPPPPPPGSQPLPPPLAPLATPFPSEAPSDQGRPEPVELAGWADGFFIRDAKDYFRFFPRALLQTDVYGFAGPGVAAVPAVDGGVGLKTRLLVRRARLELGGEFLKRWTFRLIGEFGGQDLANTSGATELSASKAGQTPSATSARYAPIQSVTAVAALNDVWVNFSVAPLLNFMVGQMTVPFSLENRISEDYNPWLDRSLPIRGFVVPNRKDLGGLVWGDVAHQLVAYELGVFGGDGQNRPSVDNYADFIGRVTARPFSANGTSMVAKTTQVGVSGRFGKRDPSSVAYDYPAMSTAQGFVLWSPAYTDALGRHVHVLPSDAQAAIGGELRTQFSIVSLSGEAYYVHNNTREAVEGYQLTNTERLGTISGAGWYGQVTVWPAGDPFIPPEPGGSRTRALDLSKRGERPKRGLELLGIVGGVNAKYDGAARGGAADTKAPATDITMYQFGLGATWWQTKHIRLMANYTAYYTPSSGSSANAAVVPSNIEKDTSGKVGTGHLLHEIGGRVSISF